MMDQPLVALARHRCDGRGAGLVLRTEHFHATAGLFNREFSNGRNLLSVFSLHPVWKSEC